MDRRQALKAMAGVVAAGCLPAQVVGGAPVVPPQYWTFAFGKDESVLAVRFLRVVLGTRNLVPIRMFPDRVDVVAPPLSRICTEVGIGCERDGRITVTLTHADISQSQVQGAYGATDWWNEWLHEYKCDGSRVPYELPEYAWGDRNSEGETGRLHKRNTQ